MVDQAREDERFMSLFEEILRRIYPNVRTAPVENDPLCSVQHFVPSQGESKDLELLTQVWQALEEAGYTLRGCTVTVGSYGRMIIRKPAADGEVEITSHIPPMVGLSF